MLSILNLGLPEMAMIAGIAVIVFGRRLPEVAAQAYRQIVRLRQSLETLRRETGIDREMRNIEHEVRDAAMRARVPEPMLPPTGSHVAWDRESEREDLADTEDEASEESAPAEDVPPPSLEDRRESG